MIDLGQGVLLVTRQEWQARSPRTAIGFNPTFGTTAHWEGPHMGWPWDHAACFSMVRGIQAFHMDNADRRWSDIAYTALPCPHGFVFQGRWVGARTAANGTTDGNNRAYALCYLGGEGDEFTPAGRRAMRVAMDFLDVHSAGPARNGHRDWKATACPGDDIYGWVHAGQPIDSLEDDMPLNPADEALIERAVTRVLDRGTAFGYQGWAEHSQGEIRLLRDIYTHVTGQQPAAEVDEAELATHLLPHLATLLDPQAFAQAVVAAMPADQARKVVEELVRELQD